MTFTERTYPAATRASFISGIPKIHHTNCGGRVENNWGIWKCSKCPSRWNYRVFAALTDDQIECRFHLRGDNSPSDARETIVWVTEGKNRFTRLVPISEAHLYERFKL